MKILFLSFCSEGKWGLAGPTNIPKMAQPGEGRRDTGPLNPFSDTALHSLALTRSDDSQESCPRQNEVKWEFVPAELEGDAPLCISRSCAFSKAPAKKKKKKNCLKIPQIRQVWKAPSENLPFRTLISFYKNKAAPSPSYTDERQAQTKHSRNSL